MNYETKVTRKLRAVDSDLTVDICSEQGCGTTILVEKEEKTTGRKTRCVACLMRMKLHGESK